METAKSYHTNVGPLTVVADESAGTVTVTLPRNANNDASVNQIDVTGRLLDINSNVKIQIAGGIILGNGTGPVVVTLTPVGPVTDEDGNPITGFLEVFVSYQLKGSDGREIDGGTLEALVDLTLREN